MLKKIVIDPGHGLTLEGKKWEYHREDVSGYREGIGTQIMSKHLCSSLNPDIDVYTTRCPVDNISKIGKSGQPLWKQGAAEYLSDHVPDDIKEDFVCDGLDGFSDVRIRPVYANYINSDVGVSLHSNASNFNPNAHGVEVWYSYKNKASKILADNVYRSLIEEEPMFDGGRGIKEANTNWAWFRLMKEETPCILIEFLFHTNPVDNQMLQDEDTIARAMGAVASGIKNFTVGG